MGEHWNLVYGGDVKNTFIPWYNKKSSQSIYKENTITKWLYMYRIPCSFTQLRTRVWMKVKNEQISKCSLIQLAYVIVAIEKHN